MNHELLMLKCFELAHEYQGLTAPNPMVGAVIVKNGAIVATGAHQKAGSPHAEANAINQAIQKGIDLTGATLYCNLEPCSHLNKKTPPCAQNIISSGIKKVIVSTLDPNPHVSGNGLKLLEANGIKTTRGVCEQEGLELNEIFFTHITEKRPFIHLKWAQTLDGKIATATGDSKWITCLESRKRVHQLRLASDAVLVGANTIRKDDPELTIRLVENPTQKVPWRLVLGQMSNVPAKSKILTDGNQNKTFFLNGKNLEEELKELYVQKEVTSILVEGGPTTITQFLEKRLFDRVSLFIAPKILGNDGHHAVGDLHYTMIKDALSLNNPRWEPIGEDQLLTGRRSELKANFVYRTD